jgi:flagellar hook-length control protein FliK
MPHAAQSTQSNALLALPGAIPRSSGAAGGAAFDILVAAANGSANGKTTPATAAILLHARGKPDQALPGQTGDGHSGTPVPGTPPAFGAAQTSPSPQAFPKIAVQGSPVAIPIDAEHAAAALPDLPALTHPPLTATVAKADGGTGRPARSGGHRTGGAPVPVPAVTGTAGAAQSVSLLQAGTTVPTLPPGSGAEWHAPQAPPPAGAIRDPAVLAGTQGMKAAAIAPPADRQDIPASQPRNHAAASTRLITPFAAPNSPGLPAHDPSGPPTGPQPGRAGGTLPSAAVAARTENTPGNTADSAAHANASAPAHGDSVRAATPAPHHQGAGAAAIPAASAGLQTSQPVPPGGGSVTRGGGKPVSAGASPGPTARSGPAQDASLTQVAFLAGPHSLAEASAAQTVIDAGAFLPAEGTTQIAPDAGTPSAGAPSISTPIAGARNAATAGARATATASAAGHGGTSGTPPPAAAMDASTLAPLDPDPAAAPNDQVPGTAATVAPAGSPAPSDRPDQAASPAQDAAGTAPAIAPPAHTPAAPHGGKGQPLPDLPGPMDGAALPVSGDAPAGGGSTGTPANAPIGAQPSASPTGAPAGANPAPPSPAGMQLVHTLQNAGAVHITAATARDITIHLQPGTLGGVQVRIERAADGAATVTLQVEKAETLHALQMDATHLHQALDRAGLPAAGRQMSFELAQPAAGTGLSNPDGGSGSFGPGQNSFQNQSQGGFQGGGGQRGQASPVSPPTPAAEPDRTATRAPGRAAIGINITA